MPTFQYLITIMITALTLIVFLMIAWYIAVPLIAIWAILSMIRWLKAQWQIRQETRLANGCTIRRAPQKPAPQIIDADYTEID